MATDSHIPVAVVGDAELVAALEKARDRIVELEQLLAEKHARIAELEEQLTAPADKEIPQ